MKTRPISLHSLVMSGVMLLFTSALSACFPIRAASVLREYPTAAPDSGKNPAQSAPLSTIAPGGSDLPAPLQTIAPALALPNASGTTIACAANTLRLPLHGADGNLAAASRIEEAGEYLYLLANGDLYRVPRLTADSGAPVLEPLINRGEEIEGRPVQELADLAVSPVDGSVYALDKAGHVYRFDSASGEKSLAYRADSDEEEIISPQLVAITLDDQGRLLMLDTAHGMIWTPQALTERALVNDSSGMTESADLALADGQIFVMRQDGSIRLTQGQYGWVGWQGRLTRRLGLALHSSDHLGSDILYTVDAVNREIIGMLPGDPETIVLHHLFAFPDMGLLRDAVFAGGRLYAVADNELFVYPAEAGDGGGGGCAALSAEEYARPTLYGLDAIAILQNMTLPIADTDLPPWPRVYPGAGRLYRLGVHFGLDLYEYTAPAGFGIGWPVLAAGDGIVTQASIRYEPMSEEEFDQITEEARALGQTPPETRMRLMGKQVGIEPENGTLTFYAHLNEIAPGIVPGATVRAGQLVGTVGVTGTAGEANPGAAGPHLHFEVWLGDRYLGQGITLRETMWWFEQGFNR
ncbi:MAG: M23 family metallopeptidase [Chloroflexota bacterium]